MIDSGTFQGLRPYLFSVAYRILSSATEAEDLVQEAWLRSASAPPDVASPRAWLTTVVTRLALDRLKSAQTRREEYVGTWLPEPVSTTALESAEDIVMRRESITMAFLLLLETLSPAERAAFVLREAFDMDYDAVAATLDTTPASVRQLVHRAKGRLKEGRPRFEVPVERQNEVVSQFLRAAEAGDISHLQQILADDVIFTADGGGKVPAARKPVVGVAAVANLIHGLWHKSARGIDADPNAWQSAVSDVNGEPALLAYLHGKLDTVFVFSTDGVRVTAIRVVRNPEKLAWLAQQ